MRLPQNPTVRFSFRGLLAFCFNSRLKHCQIGVLSTDDHELRCRLIKKRPDPGGEEELSLTISHGLLGQTSELWLDVEGGVTSGRRPAEPFIAGRWDDPPTDPRDFRWVTNLEGPFFYDRPLKVRSGVLRPVLVIRTGLFYSAQLTSNSYLALPDVPKRARGATKAPSNLGQIAECIGADLCLHPNQALVLRAGRDGPELLRLEREESVTYEVAVENLDTTQATVGRDFGHYYGAFELNQGEPRIFPVPYGLPSFGGEGGVCLVVWLSRSDDLMVE
jgi:hypothetical protein